MPRILKMIVTVGAMALLSLFIAAPVGAAHPVAPLRPFSVQADGEDGCTVFHSAGEIAWHATHLPETPTITVTGWQAIAVPGASPDPNYPDPCLPHPVSERQIEFSVSGSDFPLGVHVVPFGFGDSGAEYEFDFSARIEIDTVSVAICLPRLPDGTTWPDRCGESQTITRTDVPDDPYCQYSLSTSHWNGGYVVQIGITPLAGASSNWRVEVDLADGSAVTSAWNSQWTQNGSAATMTGTGWSSSIPAGGTLWVGFVGSGDPPTAIRVFVDGQECVKV